MSNKESNIIICRATSNDIEDMLKLRMEFIKEIKPGYKEYDLFHIATFEEKTREYFLHAIEHEEQITYLAFSGDKAVACGSLCFVNVMPTLDHISGKRGHLMNIYTEREYRRKHIGFRIVDAIVAEARQMGITQITLDATQEGEKLYSRYGFTPMKEGMKLCLLGREFPSR